MHILPALCREKRNIKNIKRITLRKWAEDKYTDDDTHGLISEIWHRLTMCQEKKEEKDSTAL